jgi:ubiquinone/menaquinone biosynthesis C-methylase UbiE
MNKINYLMESDEEAIRLDLKTDLSVIERQALWAGIQPGMRIADIGCGPGKTTSTLCKLASPGGTSVGIDGSVTRLEYAREHYGSEGIEFVNKNILEPLDGIGTFDFIWIRFVLEYYRDNSSALLNNVNHILKPGGILVLLDLDHNPLNHYGFPDRLDNTLSSMMDILEKEHNFDPYAGRKLYSYIFDLGYENIDVDVSTNNLVFGQIKEIDYFNWLKKVEATVHKFTDYNFHEYQGGYDEFIEEYKTYMSDPRRFSYTPLICSRGQKPVR